MVAIKLFGLAALVTAVSATTLSLHEGYGCSGAATEINDTEGSGSCTNIQSSSLYSIETVELDAGCTGKLVIT
jgi:hypothetical protein